MKTVFDPFMCNKTRYIKSHSFVLKCLLTLILVVVESTIHLQEPQETIVTSRNYLEASLFDTDWSNILFFKEMF